MSVKIGISAENGMKIDIGSENLTNMMMTGSEEVTAMKIVSTGQIEMTVNRNIDQIEMIGIGGIKMMKESIEKTEIGKDMMKIAERGGMMEMKGKVSIVMMIETEDVAMKTESGDIEMIKTEKNEEAMRIRTKD